MPLPESPFAEVLDALWAKLDDTENGANLLHSWAADQNPGTGLTTFRVDDAETGGFPSNINSSECPAIHIGSAAGQEYGWAVSRTVELPELYTCTGIIASRNSRDVEKFLWLVLRAFWYDYPRLLDDQGVPLEYIKSWQVTSCKRGVKAENRLPFWKFELQIRVKMCFDLRAVIDSA